MKLIVCWGTFTANGHACGHAYKALKEAGHDPEVQHGFGWHVFPDALNLTPGRREAKRLTGLTTLPVLVLDDGTAIADSTAIAAWARENQAGASPKPAA
jgi:glutathione S-transferase